MTGVATRRRPTSRCAAATLVALLALTFGLAGCRGADDPRDELERAVEATAAEPFTFALSARADRAALDQLGDDAVAAASFLEGASVSGAREPDGRLRIGVTLGGGAPLLEVIAADGDALLLRTGLGEVLGLAGADPLDDLGPALEARGVDEAGRRALATSFAGGWVELTDVDDLGALLEASRGGADPAATDAAATDADATGPSDLDQLLSAVAVTGARDAGEVRRLDVEVSTSALLAPFGAGATDRTVPGTVDLREGKVLEVRLELTSDDLVAEGDGVGVDAATGGVIELVLRIEPVAEGAAVEQPEAGASLTAAELSSLLEALQGAGSGDGSGDGSDLTP